MVLDTKDNTTIEELAEEVVTQATLTAAGPAVDSAIIGTVGEWKRAVLYILSRYEVKP